MCCFGSAIPPRSQGRRSPLLRAAPAPFGSHLSRTGRYSSGFFLFRPSPPPFFGFGSSSYPSPSSLPLSPLPSIRRHLGFRLPAGFPQPTIHPLPQPQPSGSQVPSSFQSCLNFQQNTPDFPSKSSSVPSSVSSRARKSLSALRFSLQR